MGQVPTPVQYGGQVPPQGPEPTIHPDALELAALLRPAWPTITTRLRASGTPLCEGDGGDGGSGDGGSGAGDGGSGGAGGGDGGSGGAGGGDGGSGGGDDRQTFDRAYVEQLRREAASHRTKAGELQTQLKQYEDRDKSDQQKLEERASTAEQRATTAEAQLLRFDVARDKNVPLEFAHRLTGSTKEELEQDADELLKLIGNQQQRTSFDGGTRQSAPAAGDMDSAIRAAAGRG